LSRVIRYFAKAAVEMRLGFVHFGAFFEELACGIASFFLLFHFVFTVLHRAKNRTKGSLL
jgi:hypothetical protein